jgi:Uncharacterized protein conserved in bacteria (DUF2272)
MSRPAIAGKPRVWRFLMPTLAGLMLSLAACRAPTDPLAHVPPFARVPFEPFSRTDAIAIAMREWRAWGQPIDDDPPDTRPEPALDDKPERTPGLWERVGEYWWLGIDAGLPETGWTGKHDEDGKLIPDGQDGNFAWSAAFISYVMRIAGAGTRFPYAISHATYIDVARQMSLGQTRSWAVWAEAPESVAPMPGDLICHGRGSGRNMRFAGLPASHFPSHCAIVVDVTPGSLTVIGGNVDDAVTMTHVPTTLDGRLAGADGVVVDQRYPWFVVIRVLYDR